METVQDSLHTPGTDDDEAISARVWRGVGAKRYRSGWSLHTSLVHGGFRFDAHIQAGWLAEEARQKDHTSKPRKTRAAPKRNRVPANLPIRKAVVK